MCGASRTTYFVICVQRKASPRISAILPTESANCERWLRNKRCTLKSNEQPASNFENKGTFFELVALMMRVKVPFPTFSTFLFYCQKLQLQIVQNRFQLFIVQKNTAIFCMATVHFLDLNVRFKQSCSNSTFWSQVSTQYILLLAISVMICFVEIISRCTNARWRWLMAFSSDPTSRYNIYLSMCILAHRCQPYSVDAIESASFI